MLGRGSSVGIATRYGLDDPGIESWLWARISAPVQTGPGANPASGSLTEVNRPGRGVDHPLPSSAEVKERVGLYILFFLWALVACSRANLTLKCTHYLINVSCCIHTEHYIRRIKQVRLQRSLKGLKTPFCFSRGRTQCSEALSVAIWRRNFLLNFSTPCI
jgi:hypothetical protein